MKKIRYLGLTGGISCGKSTVAKFFEKLGAYIIDADEISRAVMKKGGSAYADVVNFFGDKILDNNGEIDRRKLREFVFQNSDLKNKLEEFTHPKILEYEKRLVSEFKSKNDKDLIITQAALIIEKGTYRRFDAVIVVYLDKSTQIKRLIQRDKIDEDLALKIISSQMGIDEKLKYADFVIDNSGAIEETEKDVKRVFDLIKMINYGLKHQTKRG
jgi:dephospho-CoA kinase